MKVNIKNFPRYFYINESIRETTKDYVIAKLWFHLGDNVTVCSNLTGEVLDEWRHVDPNEPSVKKALEIAARHGARGIDIRENTIGFFVPITDGVECCEELCAARIYPEVIGTIYDPDLIAISKSKSSTHEFYVQFKLDMNELV